MTIQQEGIIIYLKFLQSLMVCNIRKLIQVLYGNNSTNAGAEFADDGGRLAEIEMCDFGKHNGTDP